MFQDENLSEQKTLKVAKDTTDNPVTELIYWVRMNLDDAGVSDFTKENFTSIESFSDALKLTIRDLGVLDEKGLVSNFSFFISGEKKRQVYLAGVLPLTVDQKAAIEQRFGAILTDCEENLYRMEWQ